MGATKYADFDNDTDLGFDIIGPHSAKKRVVNHVMSNEFCFPADDVHINRKNFPSFFRFTEQEKFELFFHQKRKHLITAFGNYQYASSIQKLVKLLKGKHSNELLALEVQGVSFFNSCRVELLSFIMAPSEWFGFAKSITETK